MLTLIASVLWLPETKAGLGDDGADRNWLLEMSRKVRFCCCSCCSIVTLLLLFRVRVQLTEAFRTFCMINSWEIVASLLYLERLFGFSTVCTRWPCRPSRRTWTRRTWWRRPPCSCRRTGRRWRADPTGMMQVWRTREDWDHLKWLEWCSTPYEKVGKLRELDVISKRLTRGKKTFTSRMIKIEHPWRGSRDQADQE